MVGGCFTYETPILTSDGQKAIGEIKIGDKVWSKDQLIGEVSLKPVTNVYVHQVNSLLNLWVKGQKLTTTKNHIFYVAGKGWIEAGQILPKDKVMMKDGSLEEVTGAEEVALTEAVNVYNFEVADWHTYFVGQGVLVHNQSTESCEAIGKLFGGAAKALTRADIMKCVEDILAPYASKIKSMYPDARIGYRGSLARGYKGPHKVDVNGNPLPFDSNDFDIDAFIVNDELAAKFASHEKWRSGNKIPEIKKFQNELQQELKNSLPGLRNDELFEFRIWTKAEFEQKVGLEERVFIGGN